MSRCMWVITTPTTETHSIYRAIYQQLINVVNTEEWKQTDRHCRQTDSITMQSSQMSANTPTALSENKTIYIYYKMTLSANFSQVTAFINLTVTASNKHNEGYLLKHDILGRRPQVQLTPLQQQTQHRVMNWNNSLNTQLTWFSNIHFTTRITQHTVHFPANTLFVQ